MDESQPGIPGSSPALQDLREQGYRERESGGSRHPVPSLRGFLGRDELATCNECNIEKGNRDKKLINGRGTTGNDR
ncbi:MAG: hypothetical protein ACLTZT_00065 [Butyricimonas faecalis]